MEDVEKHSKVHGAETHGVQNGDGVEHQPYTNLPLKNHFHGTKNGNVVSLKQNQLPKKLSKRSSPRKLHVTNHGAPR
jgi:hypothetical protein